LFLIIDIAHLEIMLYKIFVVIALSSFEIYVAIASGLAFKLSPHVICISTLIGGFCGVFITAFAGDKIKSLIGKYKKPSSNSATAEGSKNKLLNSLWDKYGVFGVGFLGTFLVGAPVSIGVGYGFGVKANVLVKWCLMAVTIRCIIFSYFFDFVKNIF
jgi:Ca2+/H+ antiporter, TMEM165/GDT1 family